MAKKNKNSNYVTEKTISAKEKQQKAKRNKAKKQKITAIVLSVCALALIAALIFGLFSMAKYSAENSSTPSVSHDHDGDGVPDHGDDAHN